MASPPYSRRPLRLDSSISAREAAEALFTRPPQDRDVAVVVVKRRRLLTEDASGQASSLSEAPQTSNAVKEHRVFRLASPALVDETAQSVLRSVPTAVSAELELQPLESGVAIPRRKRGRKHGAVTVIRPGPISESKPIPVSGQENLVATVGQSASRPTLALQEQTSYERMLDQISQLKAEAEKVRARETEEAVRWIRQAIADYGLNAADLELR